MAHRSPQPEGQMASRGATTGHLVAQLLGQQSLAPSEDAGHPQPSSLPLVVKFLPGQPLKVASPKERASQGGGPRSHSLWQGKNLGKVPELAENKNLQNISPLAQEEYTPGPPAMDGRLNTGQTALPGLGDRGGQGWGEDYPESLELFRSTDPGQQPDLPAGPAPRWPSCGTC